MQEHNDFLVIGAGMIGISIGNSLLEKKPGAKVIIADIEEARIHIAPHIFFPPLSAVMYGKCKSLVPQLGTPK